MKRSILSIIVALTFCYTLSAQVPIATAIQIAKAEDARRYDSVLETLMRSPNASVRTRAALAAGRIGDENAIPALVALLEEDADGNVRAMAAFALGETESAKAADAVLRALKDDGSSASDSQSGNSRSPALTARLVEAAGKIAAANPKDANKKSLDDAIIATLDSEAGRQNEWNRDIVLQAITAALRSRPAGADVAVAKYLTSKDARIRADACNTLARVRAKNANKELRDIVLFDADVNARVNAIKALAAADDKDALNLLIEAATVDKDPAIRIAAIRSLGSLKDAKAADRLLEHGEELINEYTASAFQRSSAQNELLELFTTLARLIPNSENGRALALISKFKVRDNGFSAEAYTAQVRISPRRGDGKKSELKNWHQYSTLAQMVAEFANIDPITDEGKKMKSEAAAVLQPLADAIAKADPIKDGDAIMAGPDILQAYARFKPNDLGDIARIALQNRDVQIRAAAAGILSELPTSKVNSEALQTAFTFALIRDKDSDDAQLAILDALATVDKKAGVGTFMIALNAQDYLVRKKAFAILDDAALQKEFPGLPLTIEHARSKHKDQVLPYMSAFGTKLGQLLNTDADYRRALSRKNGSVKAVLTTEKGTFTIVFAPEEAPLTVDNWVKLARAGYFNGLEVHRVVPDFVMQDGDPRGDGNGGPGWSIRCEVNMLPYDRGAVGMALSGKDTGGSQWFVTHLPQPHLDGGYTVFGHVNETDMKVVDKIVRGDKIIKVVIVEGNTTPRVKRPTKR